MSNQTEKDLLVSLHDKFDELKDEISEIKVTMAKQEVNLQLHMKRSDTIEREHNFFKTEVRPALEAYKFVAFLFKIVVPVITVIGLYFKYFNG